MRVARMLGLVLALGPVGMGGCSTDDAEGSAQNVILTGSFAGTGGSAGAMAFVPIGAGGVGGAAGTGSTLPPAMDPAPTQPGADGVPCEVATILHDKCLLCHTDPPVFGAPMALTTLASFHVPSFRDPSKDVRTSASERVNTAEVALHMPPASAPQLDAAQLEILNNWLNNGATAGATSCSITNPPTSEQPMAGMGGTMQPVNPGGSGGLSDTEIQYDDPEMQCYQFLAHAPGNKATPYGVGIATDEYMNFDFVAPWTGTQYARAYKSVINNPEVVHHWLLYLNSGAKADGAVSGSSGAHPDGQLVQGWAPGGTDMYFDPDVGTQMPNNTSYTLELHYNNNGPNADSNATDMSGIEVCVTPKVPTYVATVSWLGTDALGGTTATGTCDPTSNERIHLIGGTPHMHTKGTHMKVEQLKADGSIDILHDLPFDFAYQRGYLFDVWIEPGDRVRTTCSFNAPAQFGEGTGDEMCYFFSMHYPAMALTNNNFIAQLAHGQNTCLQ